MHAGILAVLQAAVAGSIVVLSRWAFRPFRVERTEAQHFRDCPPRQAVWHFHVPRLLKARAKVRAIGKRRNANEMGGPARQEVRSHRRRSRQNSWTSGAPSEAAHQDSGANRRCTAAGVARERTRCEYNLLPHRQADQTTRFGCVGGSVVPVAALVGATQTAWKKPSRLREAQMAAGDTYWVLTLKLPHPQTQLSLILIARPELSSSKA